MEKTSSKIVPYVGAGFDQGNDASYMFYFDDEVYPRVDRPSSLYLCWWGRMEKG